MKKQDIKRHLQPYSIYQKRKSTINHAFASAVSVADSYNEEILNAALRILGQNPDDELKCVFCPKPAETWDHLKAVVKNSKFSGYGHQIGNLVPCCKECNSKKGNRDWKEFLISKNPDERTNPDMIIRIENYISNNSSKFENLMDEDIKKELEKFDIIKQHVFDLLILADKQAELIRDNLRKKREIIIEE